MPKPSIYEVRRPGWRSYFELFIHRTQKDMLRYVRKEALYGHLNIDDSTMALVLPVYVTTRVGIERQREPLFAEMHLNEEMLAPGTVAHESLHVAMAHERMTMFGMDYGAESTEDHGDEERLAYLLTAIVDGVEETIKMHKRRAQARRRE